MNREKEDQLPLMQVGFIDSICLPIYEVSVHDSHANCLLLHIFVTTFSIFKICVSFHLY